MQQLIQFINMGWQWEGGEGEEGEEGEEEGGGGGRVVIVWVDIETSECEIRGSLYTQTPAGG
jgi:hypothetical protein